MLESTEQIGKYAKLVCWLHEPSEEMPRYNVRPAVVVCPGGAYAFCSAREADPVAAHFFAAGYQVFLLFYSVGEHAADWQPMIEAAEAICMLRSRSAEWNLDPARIAICGFSAGGHLAASTALLWDAAPIQKAVCAPNGENRPNAVILGYPVITAGPLTHAQSLQNIAGENESLHRQFSLENQVRPGMPPFFVWHTVADPAVPVENSLLLARALQKNKVPFELHLFAEGGHGMSLCTSEVGTRDAHNAHWMELCLEWLGRIFDFPE